MTFKLMKQLLVDPLSAINDAKRSINENKVFTLLIVESIIFGLAIAVALHNFGASAALYAGTLVAVGSAALLIFNGFLMQVVFTILGGKGNYSTGLTTVVYPRFPLAVGMFIASLLFITPYIGLFLGALILIIMVVISIALSFQTAKELFRVDMITALVGLGITTFSIFIALYISIILASASNPLLLSMLKWR